MSDRSLIQSRLSQGTESMDICAADLFLPASPLGLPWDTPWDDAGRSSPTPTRRDGLSPLPSPSLARAASILCSAPPLAAQATQSVRRHVHIKGTPHALRAACGPLGAPSGKYGYCSRAPVGRKVTCLDRSSVRRRRARRGGGGGDPAGGVVGRGWRAS